MSDTYTYEQEVVEESGGGGCRSTLKRFVVGGGLFLVAFPTLFFNEGRAVRTEKSLNEGQGLVQSVDAAKVDPANEGKLIHFTGETASEEKLSDPLLGGSIDGIRLERTIQRYLWVEKKTKKTRKKGNKKVKEVKVSYEKQWVSDDVDSNQFEQKKKYWNPPPDTDLPLGTNTTLVRSVTVGAFHLPESIYGKLGEWTNLAPTEEMVQKAGGLTDEPVRLDGDTVYLGADPTSPRVGDYRITFRYVPHTTVSVVGMQKGASVAPYPTEAGDELLLVENGAKNAQAMFQSAQAANTGMTWFLRILGFFMMFFGLRTFFKPVVGVASGIPLVGTLVDAGLGLFAGLVSFGLSMLTIGFAWLFYRPLLGLTLLVLAGGSIAGLVVLARRKRAVASPAPA